MSTFYKPILTCFLILLSITATGAQRTDGGVPIHCPFTQESLERTGPLNSTGTQAFRFDTALAGNQDWYFSVTYNDTRAPNAPTAQFDHAEQYFKGWLSIPENITDVHVCFRLFQGLEAKAGGQYNGCENVLGSECANDLMHSDLFPYRFEPDGVPLCPGRPSRLCDGSTLQGEISHRTPRDLSISECTISSPPGVSSIPSGYRTVPAHGYAQSRGRADPNNSSNFTWYDRNVQWAQPIIITALFDEGKVEETQVVCMAPDQLVGESRVPEEQLPDESKATTTWVYHQRWRAGLAAGLMMAGFLVVG